MKLRLGKLNQTGAAHFLIPGIVILLVAVIGTAYLVASHADTPTNGVSIMDYRNSAQSNGVSIVDYQVNYSGFHKVNRLVGGAKLNYTQGIKGAVTACYEFSITPLKGGPTTAKVQFASNSFTVTQEVPYSTSSNFQVVCAPPGNQNNPGFSVYNLSSSTDGPWVNVFRSILTY